MHSAARLLPLVHARETPFSYQCRSCCSCCHDKRIQLNPYELARLSRHLGCTTTEVIAHYTTAGGTVLATRGEGACIFLGDSGCNVHPARPLACRLYPLGRIALHDGRDIFVEHEPHPDSRGVYGTGGTVGAFLDAQETEPYLTAAEGYYAIVRLLQSAPGSHVTEASGAPLGQLDDFIDADLALTRAGLSVSGRIIDTEELVAAHLELLEHRARLLARASSAQDLVVGSDPASGAAGV